MTDTAFMGRVGEVELGASAIAGVYYLAIFMLGFGFSIGSQILIARRNGEGNFRMIGSIFYQGIYFLLGMALVMFTLSRLFSPWILSHVVASQRICEAAVSYINWRVFGFFFSFVAIMFRAFFVGTTQTKTLTLNSIVMVTSNVVFNYILVFGKPGISGIRYCRSSHRFFTGRTGVHALFHYLHHAESRLRQIRTEPTGKFPMDGTETHHGCITVDHDTECGLHQYLVLVLYLY